MDSLGKTLIFFGVILIAMGGGILVFQKLGWHTLPGDIQWQGKGVQIYFPLGSCILLSVILTLLMRLLR